MANKNVAKETRKSFPPIKLICTIFFLVGVIIFVISVVTNYKTYTDIQQLEFLYQKYDLVHNFIRLFGKLDTRDANKELLRKKKKEVSDELTAILKKKKLKRRQCSSCGRFLPYNYPYGMCSDCYEEMQARRYERYYGYGNFEDY